MSPTVFRHGPYRFFFSREEKRMHVHVYSPDGEAKFWREPVITMASSMGFRTKQIAEIKRVVEEHRDELIQAWHVHFGC